MKPGSHVQISVYCHLANSANYFGGTGVIFSIINSKISLIHRLKNFTFSTSFVDKVITYFKTSVLP